MLNPTFRWWWVFSSAIGFLLGRSRTPRAATLRWEAHVREYRNELAAKREAKEAVLSSAFWLYVYENDGQSRTELEAYFAAAERGALRGLPEEHREGLDALYGKVRDCRSFDRVPRRRVSCVGSCEALAAVVKLTLRPRRRASSLDGARSTLPPGDRRRSSRSCAQGRSPRSGSSSGTTSGRTTPSSARSPTPRRCSTPPHRARSLTRRPRARSSRPCSPTPGSAVGSRRPRCARCRLKMRTHGVTANRSAD